MGVEGRKIVESEFSLQRMCQGMYDLYQSMLAKRHRPGAGVLGQA
jgi:hypothetical protein